MTDIEPPEDQWMNGATIGVRLARLSVPPAVDAPTVAEVGLAAVEEECTNWEIQRGSGDLWELNATAGRLDAWREIPVLMGSTAESALIACTAEVEIECFRRGIQEGRLDPHFGLAQRFFSEGQAQQILGVGHRLANIALRTMMLARGYPWDKRIAKFEDLRQPPPAFSDDRRHWIGVSELARFRPVAAASPHPALVQLVDVVIAIARAPEWRALDEQRGKDFHRAREESPFVAGAKRVSVWTTDGTTRTLSGGLEMPTAEEVARWQASLGGEAHDAVHALAGWLREFRQALYAAVPEITGGNFRVG